MQENTLSEAISELKVDESTRSANPNRVFQTLQERIADKAYAPGAWLPTERELAREFSVNRSVIRDALLRLEHAGSIERQPGCRPRVSETSREAAGTGARAATRNIAVVLPLHEMDYASREIVRGISLKLRSESAPYNPTLFDVFMHAHEPFMMEQQACDAILSGEAAGAIVWPTLHPHAIAEWRKVHDLGYPVVFVDRFDDTEPCDFVGVDNYTAAREAVEYLIQLGHTKIAHLTTSEQMSAVVERENGYLDAMQSAGLAKNQALWIIPEHMIPNAVGAIEQGIAAYGLPTAVFAVNDDRAYRCIDYLATQSVRVPDQVSVIGFDDVDRFSPRAGFLTTMRQPFEKIGQQAAHLLLRRLLSDGKAARPSQHVLLSTRLIERDSCRPIR